MSLLDTLRIFTETFFGMTDFQTLVNQDRDLVMRRLTAVVQSMSPHELDAFEGKFLRYSLGVFDQAQRIRAMELYAWLKLQEYDYYGKFRGFGTSGDPL